MGAVSSSEDQVERRGGDAVRPVPKPRAAPTGAFRKRRGKLSLDDGDWKELADAVKWATEAHSARKAGVISTSATFGRSLSGQIQKFHRFLDVVHELHDILRRKENELLDCDDKRFISKLRRRLSFVLQ